MADIPKALLDKAMFAAFEAEGYIKQDGGRDWSKPRTRIFETAAKEKVLGPKERDAKATRRGRLMTVLFPSVLGPDKWADLKDADAVLAEAVYKNLDQDVWAETNPGADRYVQRLVGMNMGNGYVLCRTKVKASPTDNTMVDAIYITDDPRCISLDYTRPDNDRFRRLLRGLTANREMLVIRQPDNADRYINDYKGLRGPLDEGLAQIQLSLQAAKPPPERDEDDEAIDALVVADGEAVDA